MRLNHSQRQRIKESVQRVTGDNTPVRLFGSRLNDQARGGDIDLLIESATPIPNPALLAAQIATQVTRAIRGRKVDVLLAAPNLKHLPIHRIAMQEGVVL